MWQKSTVVAVQVTPKQVGTLGVLRVTVKIFLRVTDSFVYLDVLQASHHKQVLEHMKKEANKFETQLENTKDALVAAEERNEKLKNDICK